LAQPSEQLFPTGNVCLDGRGGHDGNRNAGRKILEEALRIVVKKSGAAVAGLNAGSAKDTLCGVSTDLYRFVFILIGDIGRFNRANTDTVIASDALVFIQVYMGMSDGIHSKCPLSKKLLYFYRDRNVSGCVKERCRAPFPVVLCGPERSHATKK
jgi:hypothetical protein